MDTGQAVPDSRLELRPILRAFAEDMEARLRENDYKGGWDKEHCSIEYLERRLVEEFAEYLGHKSLEVGNSPEWECIDIANFAMMLWSRHLDRSAESFTALSPK